MWQSDQECTRRGLRLGGGGRTCTLAAGAARANAFSFYRLDFLCVRLARLSRNEAKEKRLHGRASAKSGQRTGGVGVFNISVEGRVRSVDVCAATEKEKETGHGMTKTVLWRPDSSIHSHAGDSSTGTDRRLGKGKRTV